MTTIEDDRAVLRTACARVDLDSAAAELLSHHATSVWLLPKPEIVARVNRSIDDQRRAETAVVLTRWLADQDFPAVEPIGVDQPVVVDGASVTFWHYYPQPARPAPGARFLGEMLRRLHQLPEPPVTLDAYRPLERLGAALEADPPLPDDDREWLDQRRRDLIDAYAGLDSALGVGWIHGDAYPGNTLWDGDRALLSDWDEVAHGPRELDLVNTHHGARTGRSAAERAAFNEAYGWDVTTWPGFPVLREMRDLHTLGAYIGRAANADTAAADELRYRIHTLRTGATDARWHVC